MLAATVLSNSVGGLLKSYYDCGQKQYTCHTWWHLERACSPTLSLSISFRLSRRKTALFSASVIVDEVVALGLQWVAWVSQRPSCAPCARSYSRLCLAGEGKSWGSRCDPPILKELSCHRRETALRHASSSPWPGITGQSRATFEKLSAAGSKTSEWGPAPASCSPGELCGSGTW